MNTLDTISGEVPTPLARIQENAGELIGYDVLDAFNRSIGTLKTLWMDAADRALFAGVTAVWIQEKVLVLPLYGFLIDAEHRTVQFPFPSDTIKEAPAVDPKSPLKGEDQRKAWIAFHLAPPASSLEEHMQGLGDDLETASERGQKS